MKRDAPPERKVLSVLPTAFRDRRGQVISNDLQQLDEALTSVVASILQESNRAAGTIIGVATSKLVAAGVVAGAFGGIAAVGVASTGTAIASLSGAAATTATLYWIGSSIGMGVAAGGVMLTGGAIIAGIPAAVFVRRRVLGRRRIDTDLSPREQAALYAALRLAAPVRAMRAAEIPISAVEMRLFARQGLVPLVSSLEQIYEADTVNTGDNTCGPRQGSLAFWPRRRLRRALARLKRIAELWREA